METVTDFIFLGFKITEDGDCKHEIKTFVPWKKNYDKARQHIKTQRHHFSSVRIVKPMVFLVVMYGCECWTIKKTEH